MPQAEVDFVFRNLERAEDISREAMLAGIDWRWETFRNFSMSSTRCRRGSITPAISAIRRCALTLWASAQFEDEATEDDLAAMVRHVQDAVKAGAIGFSTSRTPSHLTSDNRPVASRMAPFSEVQAIVRGMGDIGAGIMELAMERGDTDYMKGFYQSLVDLSAETGRPITFGSLSRREFSGPVARVLRHHRKG